MSSYIRAIVILSLHNTALGNPVVDFIYGCCSLITGYGKEQRILNQNESPLAVQDITLGVKQAGEEIGNGTQAVAKSIEKVADAQAETNKTLQTVATGAQILTICTGGIYIVKSAKEGIDWFNEWHNPDPEKAVRKEAAIKSMAILKATDNLNKCLAYNRKNFKNERGIPADCEEAYHAYAAALSYQEAERAIEGFKRYSNSH